MGVTASTNNCFACNEDITTGMYNSDGSYCPEYEDADKAHVFVCIDYPWFRGGFESLYIYFCPSCWHGCANDDHRRIFSIDDWIEFAGEKWAPYKGKWTLGVGYRVVPKFHEEANRPHRV